MAAIGIIAIAFAAMPRPRNAAVTSSEHLAQAQTV
jgi:hypothetical protein